MKKIILLIIISFLFVCDASAQMVLIVPDSIVDTSDYVEKGLYEVYVDSALVLPRYSKPIKAAFRSKTLRSLYPNSLVRVKQPEGEPTGSFEIYVDQSKLTNTARLDSVYDLVAHLQSVIEFQGQVINDVYINEIPLLNERIRYIDSLHYKKIERLENRIETLQTFIRDSIAFVVDDPIDYSLPILKGFSYDTTGWNVNASAGEYTYLDETDTRYIVFDFNRNMIVGEIYRISFDIVSNGNANFSFWLYEASREFYPDGWRDPRVSNELSFATGSHTFDYTVEYLDRHRLGIRARSSGWGFTISNIKIEKL
jgi:hypothetical protein